MVRGPSRTRRLLAGLVLSTLLITATACDPGEFYDIVNETDQPVVLISNGHEIELAAGETRSYFAIEGNPTSRWTVVSESGVVLMEFGFSWAELVERDFRIVVR